MRAGAECRKNEYAFAIIHAPSTADRAFQKKGDMNWFA
jgi:hypothetical protein